MLLSACQKSAVDPENITDDLSKLTPEELVLRNKMEQAALVLVEFSNDKEIQKEVQDLIDLKMYKDDFIKFKDLFQPESNSKLKSLRTTKFAKKFRETVSAKKLSLKSTEDDFDLEDFLVDNDLILYIPYPLSDYPDNKQTPTISFHPMTNDSLGIGYKLSKNKSTNNIELHEVDEGYSEDEPVYIISPNFIDPDDGDDTGGGNPGNGGTGHYLIKCRHMRLTKQLDGFFSGGSEVRCVFADAVVIDAENRIVATNTHYTGGYDFTRQNIRRKDFRWVNAILDPDWKEVETTNYFGAVEIDKSGSFTFGLKAAVKISDSVTLTASGLYTVKYGNDFIGQREYPRYYFFASQSNPSLESGETFDGLVVRYLSSYFSFTTEIIEY